MLPFMPFYREAGSGEGIVCIHSNASSSLQWRALMERLAGKFHVLAADSWGAGQSPARPARRSVSLRDEVSFLDPIFARAGGFFTLIGHSYGAAVALVAALRYPSRVRALAIYEPTLFSLLDEEKAPPNEADGIRETVADAGAALDAGSPTAAAERFIDYWMGTGSWAAMPEKRRGPIAASIVNLRNWANALLHEPTPLATFESLRIPVLYMVGKKSPASSRGVARVLGSVLPQVKLVEFDSLGHMAPVTHPEIVNEVIADFVSQH